MELSEEQKQSVGEWVRNGEGLSDIQKRIKEEFSISMTYMDVRFLVLDLGVDVKDKEPPLASPSDSLHTPPPPPPPPAPAPAGGRPGPYADPEPMPGASHVSVEVDRVVKPGALASGTVVFSDGQSASWSLDQTGRLTLDASVEDYRPSEQDVQAFQVELRNALETRGF